MATVTNLTTEALNVPILDAVVEPGESVDIAEVFTEGPDYWADEFNNLWPKATWGVVNDAKSAVPAPAAVPEPASADNEVKE